MTLAPIYHVLEVLTPELPAPGVVAHKYTATPRPRIPSPNGYDGCPTTAWPACMPQHRHGCDNVDDPAALASDCTPKCMCTCLCDLPKWHTCSGSRANAAGVTPCPEVACFGNGSGGPS